VRRLLNFLKSTPARFVTILLLLQTAGLYSSVRPESVPDSPPLAGLPRNLGSWTFHHDDPVDQETKDVLKADDLLFRFYVNSRMRYGASLFVAGFRSQRNGKAPHSPKNCLPGSGWTQLSSGLYTIQLDTGKSISVNRYIVSHGEDRSLVMYWYQSRDRVVADEFKAKFWVMADSLRFNRTDTALVRVVVPIVEHDEDAATRTAVDFVKAFYQPLHSYLPA
jgi:EpsI family protein